MKYQKIKAMENAIRTELNNRNTKYINTYNNLLGYFLLFDELYQTNHYDIIKSIYENNSIYHNIIYKTFENNVSERTIYRYRKQYIICFKAICSMDKSLLYSTTKELAV